MCSKARGLAQSAARPGWLEESDPTDVILNVMDGPYRLPVPYRTVARQELPSCELMDFFFKEQKPEC